MTQGKKISRGLRKRIRFEKARLRRETQDVREYEEKLAGALKELGVSLTERR